MLVLALQRSQDFESAALPSADGDRA
jgi:hypothetical protein